MEYKLGQPDEEEMPKRGTQNLVENVGTGAKEPSSWREWMATQQ